jgi:hypothetical protein
VNLILDRDGEPGLRLRREPDRRRDLEHLIRAVERQQARAARTRDVRQLRQQEHRRGPEIRCFRNDGEELGEPLSRQLGSCR